VLSRREAPERERESERELYIPAQPGMLNHVTYSSQSAYTSPLCRQGGLIKEDSDTHTHTHPGSSVTYKVTDLSSNHSFISTSFDLITVTTCNRSLALLPLQWQCTLHALHRGHSSMTRANYNSTDSELNVSPVGGLMFYLSSTDGIRCWTLRRLLSPCRHRWT